jgi:membrane-bound lytic murein transglycosylase D
MLSLAGSATRAQEDVMTLDDLMQGAEEWANENLDEDFLRSLQNPDQEKINALLEQIKKQFQGEYVIDLAQLKGVVNTLLPLLERYEETEPYAAWLKSRVDYLEVADQLRLLVPPPKTEPGQPPKPTPIPTPQQEREVWIKKLSERPWPAPAKTYVPRLKPVFARERVPPELVWLAEVESSFDPKARSPVGAAGMFQLMPATAKRFGLRRWPFDQRLKPEESATAAAKYLQVLYQRFGDWRLALAAYNSGEGTVQRLLEKHKAKTFDEIAPHLPAETQMYVPKIEATLVRREGLKLSQLRVPAG